MHTIQYSMRWHRQCWHACNAMYDITQLLFGYFTACALPFRRVQHALHDHMQVRLHAWCKVRQVSLLCFVHCRWCGRVRGASLRTFPFVLKIVLNAAWLAKPAFPISYEMLAIAARTCDDDHACLVGVLTDHLGRPCFCSEQ